MCGITCPIIKSLFHGHILKCEEDVEDCTVACDLQGKQKLNLGIQTLITAISLEGTIINYIPYSGFLSRIKLVTKIKRNDINSRVWYLSR